MFGHIRRTGRGVNRVDRDLVLRSGALPPSGLDRALRLLTLSANRSKLWFAVAAVLASRKGATRRAGLRGVAAIAAASMSASLIGKRLFPRRRPAADLLPEHRRLIRRPHSSSFPSGHAASAAAFATAVSMEHRVAGALLFPVAAVVGYSRVHTGVHWPTDVAAGAAIGVGAAYATRHWWPHEDQMPPRLQRRADAPALDDGAGLVLVVNPASGPEDIDPTDQLRELWPKADLIRMEPGVDPFRELTRYLADRDVRAVGVAGGDGTVAHVAELAARHDLPLVVVPAGTLNHFARDIDVQTAAEVAAATRSGSAIAVDLGRVDVYDGVGRTEQQVFVNTATLGGYPEMVRMRERLQSRWPKWPAAAAAMVRSLRRAEPLPITLDGTRRLVWMLFVGNNPYQPKGFGPARRPNLATGLLDVRYLRADLPYSRARFVLAALTGTLHTSHVYRHEEVRTAEVRLVDGHRRIATDGEVGPLGRRFVFRPMPMALRVYRS